MSDNASAKPLTACGQLLSHLAVECSRYPRHGRPEGPMLRVRDIMSTEVVTVPPDLTLQDTIELLTTKHVTGAPVVAGDRIVGVISATDLLSFAATTPGVP